METEEFMYSEDDYNYTEPEGWTLQPQELHILKTPCSADVMCMSSVVISTIICLLGFFGNLLVIWIAGFRMKKTVNTTWYLSLAISDFVFCASLPLNIATTLLEEWIFGRFMCKLVPSLMFTNMFSSIFVLVIISIDRCVSVMFPVWAQNQRTVKKASAVVLCAWVLAVCFSIPSMVYRETTNKICHNSYKNPKIHWTVGVSRFIAGFVVPFVVIIICYSIIIFKLRSNRMAKSTKPFKVMTVLIAAFFICWLPYHVFVLLEMNHQILNHQVLTTGLQVGTCLASANSFLNPVLYVFMGNDFRKKFKSSVLSKMENAMFEEGRTTSRYLSRSSSVDARASTHI